MKRNPIVLILAVVLFAGWLSWLGVKALGAKKPIVVSRAQLAVSEYDIEADLEANPDGSLPKSLTVHQVRWEKDKNGPAVGTRIDVVNINEAIGYAGQGTYVLPLVRRDKNFVIANLPPDPGYYRESRLAPRYYPATPEVLKQWDEARLP